jgi:hypothetical protein
MRFRTLLAGATLLIAAAPAVAAINLELRQLPAPGPVEEGNLVHIGIYAVSDNAGNQAFSTLSTIFSWNPGVMCLQSLDATGGPKGSFSFPFPDNSGINEVRPPQDGTGMMVGFSTPLGSNFTATPAGTLLRTLVFEAKDPAASSPVSILRSSGSAFTLQTQVLVGAGVDVTGTLGATTVTVTDIPDATEACRRNDTDHNGTVDVLDLLHILGNFGSPCQCCTADVTGDNLINVFDILSILGSWGCNPN